MTKYWGLAVAALSELLAKDERFIKAVAHEVGKDIGPKLAHDIREEFARQAARN